LLPLTHGSKLRSRCTRRQALQLRRGRTAAPSSPAALRHGCEGNAAKLVLRSRAAGALAASRAVAFLSTTDAYLGVRAPKPRVPTLKAPEADSLHLRRWRATGGPRLGPELLLPLAVTPRRLTGQLRLLPDQALLHQPMSLLRRHLSWQRSIRGPGGVRGETKPIDDWPGRRDGLRRGGCRRHYGKGG
jgi:hypothetical protein